MNISGSGHIAAGEYNEKISVSGSGKIDGNIRCNALVCSGAVKAQGRIYTVMKAVYTGENTLCDPLFYFVGKLGENLESDELEYITRKRRIIAKLADDIKSIESKKEKYAVLCEALLGIDRLIGNKDGN